MDIGKINGEIKLFTGNSNKDLAGKIASCLDEIAATSSESSIKQNIQLGKAEVGRFKDGEISLKIFEPIRECDVFVIQSTSYPVNENMMELLIMIDALKRASAKRITAVLPYYGYSRQDRKVRARDPISAKLVANIIASAGADRVLTMDLHSAQIQGFFDIPVDNLTAMPIFFNYYSNKFKDRSDTMVVSPDIGSVARGRTLAEKLNINLAIVDKRRSEILDDVSEVGHVIGDVSGKKVIVIDDEIDTGGSIANAAQTLTEHGAKEVYVCCTHGKFSGDAVQKIENSPIKELLSLDTIQPRNQSNKIKTLSVDKMFADAIFRIHEGISVSSLFN
ncbi:MAG: ribose-phosphate pyrophosphokinase [Defluviitaleaceae bacterium]|nr:ribose-phosphate pyrophosphokinase [Defluviitaleaceae bacterium]